MPRYKITIEYDGTGLVGWQKQKGKKSVQQLLEKAIEGFCQENVKTTAAGRTDAGVHALAQIVHFNLSKKHPLRNIQHGINHHLNEAPISVLKAEIVSDDFSARFNAKKRYYRYHIINRAAPPKVYKNRAWHIPQKLDSKAMKKGAEFFIGKHDFTSFRSTECQAKSPVKTLEEVKITKRGEHIYIDVSARSFLHNMVRNITGTLVLIGRGKLQPEKIKEILKAKDRRAAGPTAPAYGLYLTKVRY